MNNTQVVVVVLVAVDRDLLHVGAVEAGVEVEAVVDPDHRDHDEDDHLLDDTEEDQGVVVLAPAALAVDHLLMVGDMEGTEIGSEVVVEEEGLTLVEEEVYHGRDYGPPRGPYGEPYGDGPSSYGPPRGGPPRGRGGGGEERRRGREEGPPGISLLVRNVSPDATTADLQRAFGKIGEVRDVYIPRDYHSQQPKGFAFIEYADPEKAREARDEMDRFRIKGRELEVVFAQERRKTPKEMRVRGGTPGDRDRGGSGGGGGSDRGRGGRNFERSSSFERHQQRRRGEDGNRERKGRDEGRRSDSSRKDDRKGAEESSGNAVGEGNQASSSDV
ncbi:MAG: hypothetical protein SGBAC_009135 [Bacillariaceae sp.]